MDWLLVTKLTKTVKEENPRVEHVLDGREWNELPAPNQSYLEKRDQVLYFAASNHRSDDEKDAGVVQRLLSDFAGYGSVKETRVLETGQIGLHK